MRAVAVAAAVVVVVIFSACCSTSINTVVKCCVLPEGGGTVRFFLKWFDFFIYMFHFVFGVLSKALCLWPGNKGGRTSDMVSHSK